MWAAPAEGSRVFLVVPRCRLSVSGESAIGVPDGGAMFRSYNGPMWASGGPGCAPS